VSQDSEARASVPGSGRPPETGGKAAAREFLGRIGRALTPLFPQPPEAPRSYVTPGIVLAHLVAVGLGAFVLLERQPGVPAWDTIGEEDRKIFLAQALLHPWGSLFRGYNGYLELVPRLIGEVIARLPYRDAAVGFAFAGALIAACCAVFVFHASAGHIRRPALRALLFMSVLLLPTALYEINDSGVNTPWYLLFALFWALLWRPRSRAGMILAFLLCLAAAASNVLAVAFAPVVVARALALPRVREQAATLGWLAGGVLQVPVVLVSSRHNQVPPLAGALGFYARNVILAGVGGHHWAAVATNTLGVVTAAALAGCVVAAMAAWGLFWCGPKARLFVATALVTGFLLTMLPVAVHGYIAVAGEVHTIVFVHGSRYAQVPILLLYSAVLVALDAFLSRSGIRFDRSAGFHRAAPGLAAVLVVVLAFGSLWAADFRWVNRRATQPTWATMIRDVRKDCKKPLTPAIRAQKLPAGMTCSMVGRVPRPPSLRPGASGEASRMAASAGPLAARRPQAGTAWLDGAERCKLGAAAIN
jgi:hypothetical protein